MLSNHGSSTQPGSQRNQEKEAHSLLASRYLWLIAIDSCPGACIVDIQQCRALLHLLTQIATQRVTTFGEVVKTLRHRPPDQEIEENLTLFLEDINLILHSFETNDAFRIASNHFSFSRGILYLEGFLDTRLSIPMLRPFLLPLPESKVVHVVSRMLDYLLGAESLESIPEMTAGATSAEPGSGQATAMETIGICTQFIMNFVAGNLR